MDMVNTSDAFKNTTYLNVTSGNKGRAVYDRSKYDLVSNDAVQYIYTINMAIVCALFCLFGIVTNIINIIIFVRQGFQETSNIALLGLAISDFCSLISLLWSTICFNPYVMYADNLPFIPLEVQHITGGFTHVIFTRITAFITVYITLERCLSIASPLKVKRILTPKRVILVIIAIYVVIIAIMSPGYYSVHLGWRFVASKNRTLLGVKFAKDRYLFKDLLNYLNFICPSVSFISVGACSAILIWKLKQRGKWLRDTNATYEHLRRSRDQQVIKMILCVAIVFMTTYAPSVIFFLTMAEVEDLNLMGKYQNLFMLLCSIAFTLDAINSGVNIFVYYVMSTKYRLIFRSMFGIDRHAAPKNSVIYAVPSISGNKLSA